jgi:hypothetical protein
VRKCRDRVRSPTRPPARAVASVNPLATREEQLANIRQIYPPEREALGVVAIGIRLVDAR